VSCNTEENQGKVAYTMLAVLESVRGEQKRKMESDTG
jgi:hypothetical protein